MVRPSRLSPPRRLPVTLSQGFTPGPDDLSPRGSPHGTPNSCSRFLTLARYDVDGSNSLEKHELVQALFELDMVPGHDVHEKRMYLEDQFAIADTNGRST